MKRKLVIGVAVAFVVVVTGLLVEKNTKSLQEISYKTTVISRGSVENLISSTGTLNPVSTIEVGTQVSGTIVKVFADYNDVVEKNQIIAEIDRQPLQSKLGQVLAAYSKNEALFEQAKSEYERNKPLHEKGIISDEEFISAKTNYLSQKASLEGAKADVETARTNLTYATIRSPINGTVIERSVEVGQTVAASLSAPTLFIIAEDLQKMEILADVDESDIGKIKTGQEVTFNVPAYPELTFNGLVSQVRLQPVTTQSVVTYTVVIKASNSNGTLLPGMTANVNFIAERADSALLIPSAALRFKPSDEVMAKVRKNRPKGDFPKGDFPKGDFPKGDFPKGDFPKGDLPKGDLPKGKDQNGGDKTGEIVKSENKGTIWILTDNNEIRPSFVLLGISDGTITAITGRGIEVGAKVVTGVVDKKKEKTQTQTRSLLTPSKSTQSGGPSGPPPGGF
jgi:HlyD family secretion protein